MTYDVRIQVPSTLGKQTQPEKYLHIRADLDSYHVPVIVEL
jgi:hypothetical protein